MSYYYFGNSDGITPITNYQSNIPDWVSTGKPIISGETTLLTMAEGTLGTMIASTSYMWYGTVSIRLNATAAAGVVTSIGLFADSKDEIDFQLRGDNSRSVESNYFSQGVLNCECSKSS